MCCLLTVLWFLSNICHKAISKTVGTVSFISNKKKFKKWNRNFSAQQYGKGCVFSKPFGTTEESANKEGECKGDNNYFFSIFTDILSLRLGPYCWKVSCKLVRDFSFSFFLIMDWSSFIDCCCSTVPWYLDNYHLMKSCVRSSDHWLVCFP